MALVCIVLATGDSKERFIGLVAILIFSSTNCLFIVFAAIPIKMFVSHPLADSVYPTPALLASDARVHSNIPNAAVCSRR